MGRLLALIGIALTVLYAVFSWWLIGDRVHTLQSMDLNEVGDFLAGAFGPVAILWLVLGYFQQGIELRQGTAALNFQGEELRNAVEQQRLLATVSLKTLEHEREARLEEAVRYRQSLRPILHLQGVGVEFEDGYWKASCRLFNDGAQIYGLTLVLHKGGNEHHFATFRTLERSGMVEFKCIWHKDSPGDVVAIEVIYRERDAAEGTCRFIPDSDVDVGAIGFVREEG
ncbi:hypothetical protein ATI02_5638 [Pseudomonas baetica]|uniref:Uncharacterized protein n=1 Tax=Pseudomonas baetica TaxID=674054 RepID=A0ABX4Q755_9PSED|nr:hypothetical protein [Pseudomonas baetica]PKA72567.1 hypothetical protein ATI02_5638 [Pseudomonas baetica]PTC16992.1 hypothetical protein C0J26_23910 [Pseudomonas baetica]